MMFRHFLRADANESGWIERNLSASVKVLELFSCRGTVARGAHTSAAITSPIAKLALRGGVHSLSAVRSLRATLRDGEVPFLLG